MEYINLKKDNILRIGIKTDKGEDTGNVLEFDLEDIELPFRLQEAHEQHKKNIMNLKNQLIIIKKRADKKGKKLFSANEAAEIKATMEFYKKEEETIDLFLGKGGTKKLLNGRKPYYRMWEDFQEYLEPVLKLLNERAMSIDEQIKKKYGTIDEGVLK